MNSVMAAIDQTDILFHSACDALRGVVDHISDNSKLKLYGYYKVATLPNEKPSHKTAFWKMGWFQAAREQHKLGAWEDAVAELAGDPTTSSIATAAKKKYIDLAHRLLSGKTE